MTISETGGGRLQPHLPPSPPFPARTPTPDGRRRWSGWQAWFGGGGGERTNNGERFIGFCAANNIAIVITTTMYPQKDICKYTWTSPEGMNRNQVNHIAVNGTFNRYGMPELSEATTLEAITNRLLEIFG